MKILWIVGSNRNCINGIFGFPKQGIVSGGWVDVAYAETMNQKDIEIVFVFGDKGIKPGTFKMAKNSISTAYGVHMNKISFGKKGSRKCINVLEKIIDEEKPDLIHIWGTEHGLAYDAVAANHRNIKTIIFVQGIVGIHSKYFLGNYSKYKNKPNLFLMSPKQYIIAKIKHHYFIRQAKLERKIIKKSNFYISDNVFTDNFYKSINKNIKKYEYSCPMNAAFFEKNWMDVPHVGTKVFTVYGKSLDKGVFQLAKAIRIVKKRIPDIQLICPGYIDINNPNSFFEKWLAHFIADNNLKTNFVFPGYLNSNEMSEYIQKCDVFVNPSIMEVHANSLREAMLVGAPSISSKCGCVCEYLEHGRNGFLYDYNDIDYLADLICNLISNNETKKIISKESRRSIISKYYSDSKKLYDIYYDILKKENNNNDIQK